MVREDMEEERREGIEDTRGQRVAAEASKALKTQRGENRTMETLKTPTEKRKK